MTTSTPAAQHPDAGSLDSVVPRQLRAGLEYLSAGNIDGAIEAFQRGLAAPSGDASTETISELHSKLGNACMFAAISSWPPKITRPRCGWHRI
jgi:hypothetical protein